jgi:hypothetical protein
MHQSQAGNSNDVYLTKALEVGKIPNKNKRQVYL